MEISVNSITDNKLNSIQEAVGIKVLKDSLEFQKNISTQIIEALRVPFLAQNIDTEA